MNDKYKDMRGSWSRQDDLRQQAKRRREWLSSLHKAHSKRR